MPARMLYAHLLSALHCGVGQSADVIDLPIARERVTNWPLIPASSVKGPLKALLRPSPDENSTGHLRAWRVAFGPDTENADEGGGSLTFTDLRLLCFPVRSYTGTFAWVTSPLALRRWVRDHLTVGLACNVEVPTAPEVDELLLAEESSLVSRTATVDSVYLEDLDLRPRHDPVVSTVGRAIADTVFSDPEWRQLFMARFAIAHDDVFTFLTESGTEVAARVRIDEGSKTVARGALWYEEAVPAEAIFAGPIQADAVRNGITQDQALAVLHSPVILQLGGHATIGRGVAELVLVEGLK